MGQAILSKPMSPDEFERLHARRHRLATVRKAIQQLFSHLLIILCSSFFVIPFFWMLVTSFKSDRDVFRTPPTWLPYDNVSVVIDGQELLLYNVELEGVTRQLALVNVAEGHGDFIDPQNPSVTFPQVRMRFAEPILEVGLRWRNYVDAMTRATRPGLGVSFWTYFRNSMIIAFFTIIGTLLSNSPVAYAFARIRFPGRQALFIFVLATMMLPYQVTMIPMYLFFNETLRWGDSFLPLIVPSFFANAYDVFLLRQFFRTIPEELADAARVDGASEFNIFRQIILPLSVPVLATVTVFTFLWAWNDFQGPLLYLTSPQNFTMALGLQDFKGQRIVAWNLLMAASVVFTVPIIIAFFFAQRTFIQGIKLTGLKE
jgi:multiple sugar transport system permease protein